MLKVSGSGTLTKLLGIISMIFIIVYAVRRKGLNAPPLTLYVWLAFLMWLLVSMFWTVDVSNGLFEAQSMVSLVLMYAVLSVAPVEYRDLRAICICIVLGGIASSFYGMYLLHDQPMLAGGPEAGRLMINVDNRTIDANHFANAMLAPIALCMVALLNSRRPRTIVGAFVGLAVLLSGELMSLSREAMLACIVILVITVAFSKRRVLGTVVVGTTLALLPLLVPSIGARLTDAIKTGGAGRTSIWGVAFDAFQHHPFIGWGAGGGVEAYDRSFLKVFQFYSGGWSRATHNTLLQTGLELGVIGLVLILIAYFSTFRQFAGIRRGDALFDLRIAFTAALIGLGICSMFIDLASYKYFWVLLGAIAQLRTVARSRRLAAPQLVYEPPPPRAARTVRNRRPVHAGP
jgi:O-antigen ligase